MTLDSQSEKSTFTESDFTMNMYIVRDFFFNSITMTQDSNPSCNSTNTNVEWIILKYI